jgi:hypothetical protein
MNVKNKITGSLTAFVVISLVCHFMFGYITGLFGSFDLSAPVLLPSVIGVTLESPPANLPPPVVKDKQVTYTKHSRSIISTTKEESLYDLSTKRLRSSDRSTSDAQAAIVAKTVQKPFTPPRSQEIAEKKDDDKDAINRVNTDSHKETSTSVTDSPVNKMVKGPLLSGGEFVPVAREKLTYRIMLFGIPAGTAELEATNKNGEMRIITRIKSNDVFSSIYPVDIFVDTRLVVGNYLLTRIRQHEGNTVSDTGFTLMLREKNAFWVDRLQKRYANSPLPREDVKDMISGFYYLRNQRLEVGKPVQLYLFDSNEYVPSTVEVLRKEHLSLPGFREADTLVVHPILKTDGFFHSTGEILVWLTDDDKKVPVKVEAQIALGKVTAELVSAESEKTQDTISSGASISKVIQETEKSPSVPFSQSEK